MAHLKACCCEDTGIFWNVGFDVLDFHFEHVNIIPSSTAFITIPHLHLMAWLLIQLDQYHINKGFRLKGLDNLEGYRKTLQSKFSPFLGFSVWSSIN